MSNTKLKNWRRRDEARKVRHDRVVVGYIETNHPEVYKRAHEFYEQLDKIYPEKKDLRRTNEYASMGNGFPIRKRYVRKNIPKKKQEDNNRQHNIADNMVLNIPLMKGTNNQVVDMSEDPQVEVTIEQTPHEDIQLAEVTIEQTPHEDIQPAGLFPIITDEMVEDIIQDLKDSDPHFEQWFKDIDIDIDIDVEHVSPLESELLTW